MELDDLSQSIPDLSLVLPLLISQSIRLTFPLAPMLFVSHRAYLLLHSVQKLRAATTPDPEHRQAGQTRRKEFRRSTHLSVKLLESSQSRISFDEPPS